MSYKLTKEQLLKYMSSLELSFEKGQKTYSAKELKAQWRKLCQRYHPDKHSDSAYAQYLKKVDAGENVPDEEIILSPEVASAKFREVTHAYEMLTNPEYAYKESLSKSSSNINLDIPVTIQLSFTEAFFGAKGEFSYIVLDMNEESTMVLPEKTEMLVPERARWELGPTLDTSWREVRKGKGARMGDNRGDLVLLFSVNPHPVFRPFGNEFDLLMDLSLPLDIMLKGGLQNISTMHGLRELKIKPGTQLGQVYKLPKAGLRKEGDLIISIGPPKLPTVEDLKGGDEWKDVGIRWDIEDEINKEEEENRKTDEALREVYLKMSNQGVFRRNQFGAGGSSDVSFE